ncbi:MAG: ribbon-helix-helix protein, CopG family [Candidatus Vogelbacteria bacterium]|nr:ribbon-helix-helix protein, CopG family [Candidatus Vogelbacteria bacterium]
MAKKKKFTHLLSLQLPVELVEKIREVARWRGVSMAQVVREAIEEMLCVLEKDDESADNLRENLKSSREF